MNKKESLKIFILIIIVLGFLVPLYIPIINSFKTLDNFIRSPFLFPEKIYLENYIGALIKGDIFRYLINSIIVTSVSVFLTITLSSMAAFALTRKHTFKNLNRLIFIFFVIGIIIPPHASIIQLYLHLKFLKLTDTLIGLIIAFVAYNIPFSLFIMNSFFKNIPEEIEEAAVIDGCNNLNMFLRIILPLSRGAIITVAIFVGVSIWNNFLFPLVIISSNSNKTLAVGLLAIRGQYYANYPAMFAGIIILSIPLIITYLIFQNKFVEGLASGALKG